MKMNKLKLSAALAALAIVLAGCATRIGDFTMLSTKNIDLSRMDEFERGRRTTGEDITVFSVPSMEEAVDKAIEREPGGIALVDVSVETLVGILTQGWRIEGTVLIDPKLVESSEGRQRGKEDKPDKVRL